ncbi:MAG: ribonuclease D [Proteobacteria bacterium]|nr:ribonuclease D [Pseudomonadota bacterium]
MRLIAETEELAAFCRSIARAPYIAVDTEFMRERTYWPVLCLVQIAAPGPAEDKAAAIDTIAPGLALDPLVELLARPDLVKVFHAARQDIEIFFRLTGRIPAPIFDTQVAAMVCGFGDSVAYDTLAARLAGARIDKTMRFADWSKRPLGERQLAYALADVTHLCTVYERLEKMLAKNGREGWLDEEMAQLTDPATYAFDPDQAWRRLKTRSSNRRFLAVLREVAAWREREAQRRDLPRNRVLRDDALMDVAAHAPGTAEELMRARGVGRNFAARDQGASLLAAIARANALPLEACPEPEPTLEVSRHLAPLVDLLKVLLKLQSAEHGVAHRLIASAEDLERIALDDEAEVPALHGWRRRAFGDAALALKHGRLALAAEGGRLRLVPLA